MVNFKMRDGFSTREVAALLKSDSSELQNLVATRRIDPPTVWSRRRIWTRADVLNAARALDLPVARIERKLSTLTKG